MLPPSKITACDKPKYSFIITYNNDKAGIILKPLFAYFTDVHGNIDALKAVISDARSHGIDSFFCG